MSTIKNIFLFFCFVFVSIASRAQQISPVQWNVILGGSYDDDAWSMIQADDGHYIVAGRTNSQDGDITDNHSSQYDSWLGKFDVNGNRIWSKCVGSNSGDVAKKVIQTSDGNFIFTGMAYGNGGDISGFHGNTDAVVIKFDTDGNILWQKCYGGTNSESGNDIYQTSDGGYVFAGWTNSTDGDVSGFHGTGTPFDFWVVKIDADGDIQWQKCLGGTDKEIAYSIQQTIDGGYIVCGQTESGDGDVTGYFDATDMWIVKLSSTGTLQWQKCFGGSNGEVAHTCMQASDGSFWATGNIASGDNGITGYHGGADGGVLKFDPQGNLLWHRCYGGSNADRTYDIQEAEDGNILLLGFASSTDGDVMNTNPDDDLWLVKTDTSGVIIWDVSFFGSSGSDLSLVQSAEGGYAVAGFFYDPDMNSEIFIEKIYPYFLEADTVIDAVCDEGNNGSVTVSAYFGNPPYSYLWNTNPVQTGQTATGLSYGIYTVSVTDSSGIVSQGLVYIDGPQFTGVELSGQFVSGGFRPGRETRTYIELNNSGCLPGGGNVCMVLNSWVDYVTASPAPQSISGDTLCWNFTALEQDSAHFRIELTTFTSLLANIGDTVCLDMFIVPAQTDEDSSNNALTMCYPVVNSLDPNDKQVFPQGEGTEGFVDSNLVMKYMVRFQNTGNAEAIDVFVIDTLDADLDLNTFRVTGYSHPMHTDMLANNVVRFRFDGINLPDSTSNEPESHGYIMYEIAQDPDLAPGTAITNTAYIYFDFNPPVITNTVINTIYDVSIGEANQTPAENKISITPNPSSGIFNIDFVNKTGQDAVTLNVYNPAGCLVYTEKFSIPAGSFRKTIDNHFSNGIYFVRMESTRQEWIGKVIVY